MKRYSEDVYKQIKVSFEQFFGKTRNIEGLKGAGDIYKYDGYMPTTSHYDHIDNEVRGVDVYLKKALSKKMRQKAQEEGDKIIKIADETNKGG